jgi:hypothetical protein
MSKPVVLETSEWIPSSIKYMAPKTNERGGKAISMISKQTNRSLHISTPLLMTWGISDFVDSQTGESDGKYSLTLAFPNDEYSNPSVRAFLQKLKEFETQILNDEKEIGVTIMKLDEQVDHGALVAQEKIILEDVLNFNDLEKRLAKTGVELFVKIIPDWISGKIKPVEQNHEDELSFVALLEHWFPQNQD